MEAEAKIAIAEEELTRAREYLNWSETLFQEKYLSRTAFQKDQLTLKQSQLAVQLATADLDLLKGHTHTRQVELLESNAKQTLSAIERTRQKARANMAQAEADLKAKRALLEEERAELEEVELEVSRAMIRAPIDGMVLYASSVSDDWDDDEDRIDEGAIVDERGEIIYLPTASAYNVDVKILEVNLRKVRIGQSARVQIDAMPGRIFNGTVASISQLPDQDSRYLNPNLKLYNTVIAIQEIDPAHRNGMSCRVQTLVEHHADAVYVPVQCVTRISGQPMVHLVEDGAVRPRPVEIALDNGQFIHIVSGLQGGERVVLTPPLSASSDDGSAPGKSADAEADPPRDGIAPEPANENKAPDGRDTPQTTRE